jgi:LysR family cyn operon transcriptional activator
MTDGIELRHLRYFLGVAQAESFTRAAERLGISQPSVSQQIKDLETRLGTPLFRRLGGHVECTEAGRAFQLAAETVLRKLDDAAASVRALTELDSGHVEVGVIPALHLAWVPQTLAHLAREHPRVTVSVRELPAHAIERELSAGRLDVGLGLERGATPGLVWQRLQREHLEFIAPQSHPLVQRFTVDVDALADEPLVLLPPTFDIRHEVDDVLRRAKVQVRRAHEIDTLDSTLCTVVATGRATILPPIVLHGREHLGLVSRPLTGRRRALAFGIVRPESDLAPAARAFTEALRAHLAS